MLHIFNMRIIIAGLRCFKEEHLHLERLVVLRVAWSLQHYYKFTHCFIFFLPSFMHSLKQCENQASLCVKTGKVLSRPQVGLICCSRQREEEGVGQLLRCVGAPWACTYVTFPKNQVLTAPEKLGSLDCTYATWIQRSHYLQSGTSCRAIMWAVVKGRHWVRAVPLPGLLPGSQYPGMRLSMVEGACGPL